MINKEEARDNYEIHPRMQQIFPEFEDYLNYLEAYQEHQNKIEESSDVLEENINQFVESGDSLPNYGPTNFNLDTDYTGPQGLSDIQQALSGINVPDAYAMNAAFGDSFTSLGGSSASSALNNQFLEEQGFAPEVFSGFREGDNYYAWVGDRFEKRDVGQSDFSKAVRGAVSVGLALGLGPQVGAALGVGSTGLVGGAVSGAAGSAISQGITTGSIDASQLATSAVLGGIGGVAEAANTGQLAGSALDNSIWDLSGTLGVDYATTVNLLEGVATGAIQGGDVEDIVANAVGSWSTEKLQSFVSDTYGDVIDVDNFFREGTTSIDSEALYPLIEAGVNAAIEGGIDPKDALRSTIDYFAEGGSLDFILPGLPQIAEGVGIELPDIDLSGFNIDLGDLPDIDVDLGDFNIPDLGDFNSPFETIDVPEITLPDINIETPNVTVPDIAVDVPNVSGIDVGEIDVDTPDVDTPDVDLPSIDLNKPKFKQNKYEPSMFGLSYQPLVVPEIMSMPKRDYVGELNQIINRSLFEGII